VLGYKVQAHLGGFQHHHTLLTRCRIRADLRGGKDLTESLSVEFFDQQDTGIWQLQAKAFMLCRQVLEEDFQPLLFIDRYANDRSRLEAVEATDGGLQTVRPLLAVPVGTHEAPGNAASASDGGRFYLAGADAMRIPLDEAVINL
jgi:hypothetical protein